MRKGFLLLLIMLFALSGLAFGQNIQKLRESADNGDAQAQCDIGLKYSNGEGVPKDDQEAVKWYRKAAEQGHAKAQCLLGVMYGTGNGIPEDLVNAYAWLSVGLSNGYDGARVLIKAVSARMTPSQIVAAEKLSSEWSKKYRRKTVSAMNPTKQTQTIEDVAMLHVLVIDKAQNLVGVGWEDREKWGIGEQRIVNKIVALGKKYGVDLTNYRGRVLVGAREGDGAWRQGNGEISFDLPSDWTEIVSFPDLPKLPVVKFRSGKVTLFLKPKDTVITYSVGTEAMSNGSTFSWDGAQWIAK